MSDGKSETKVIVTHYFVGGVFNIKFFLVQIFLNVLSIY